jgi:membrane-associated protease RseP (regulator of RpoE activity)
MITRIGGQMMSGLRIAFAALAVLLCGAPLLLAGPPPPGHHPQAEKRTTGADTSVPPSSSSSAATSASPSGEKHAKCPYTTQECLNSMARRLKSAGWIGIEYEPKDPSGPRITKVVPGSPAEKAGLQPGDVLFALNGVEMKSENDDALMKARKDWKPGQAVQYTIKRNGTAKQVDVVLGEWPADILARYIGEHMLEHAQWDAEDAAKSQPPPKK